MKELLHSIILLTFGFFASSQSEELTLYVRAMNARFPLGIRSLQGVYDGEDSIFLFGGATFGSEVVDTIFKYSISQDEIEQVGVMAKEEMNGRVIADKEGNMYYIGGEEVGRYVQMFDGVNYHARLVGVLENPISHFGVLDLEGNWTLYGGTRNSENLTIISQWSFDTLKLVPVGTLPEGLYRSAILTFRWGHYVYHLFQRNLHEVYGLTHDLLTNATEEFQFNTVPRISSPSVSAIFDGKHVYMFSGLFNNIGVPIAWRFDPATRTAELICIHYAGTAYYQLQESCAVYIQKEKRVYLFGGTSGSMYNTAVMYIDLYPEAPTTTEESVSTTPSREEAKFNCTGREDGEFFPNPEECAEFFGCLNSEAYAFRCAHPLLFEVASQSCRFPENVDCNLDCDGEEDGLHAHPYYCNLYRKCSSEEREILACEKPLIFDPSIGSCNDPGLVECLTDIY